MIEIERHPPHLGADPEVGSPNSAVAVFPSGLRVTLLRNGKMNGKAAGASALLADQLDQGLAVLLDQGRPQTVHCEQTLFIAR